jgi:hypothetical protein
VKRPTLGPHAVSPLLVALALAVAACSGGDDDDNAPSGATTPPNAGVLPPQLLECFADKGYDIESPNQIHAAPQRVVEECFEALHQGDGGA